VRPPRRRALAHGAALLAAGLAPQRGVVAATTPASDASAGNAGNADPVRRGRPMVFPRDHGAHLGAHIEWWYVTGWLGRPEAPTHGFQVTFFRSRTGLASTLPGRLAPRQLLFAHAALTDLAARRHVHDQRIVRWDGRVDTQEGPRAAGADTADARVWIGSWRLQQDAAAWHCQIDSRQGERPWSLDLRCRPSQPVLLQGDGGFSRKGPEERHASHYLSLPQLAVRGTLDLTGQTRAVEGTAWLDHEWSDELLPPGAVGWDWLGINLFDGGALTLFQLRGRDGATLWVGGSLRSAGLALRSFGPRELSWTPGRRWRSPVTAADYPVDWQIDTPVGRFRVRALLDGQELDSRQSTGSAYWEGLSECLDAQGRRVGLGYLEMTGYAGALRL
jgi:predicted secreted hydrolase